MCVLCSHTHPILARKELVGPGGERGRSESSYMGGGMAALGPLVGRASSSLNPDEPKKQNYSNCAVEEPNHIAYFLLRSFLLEQGRIKIVFQAGIIS